MRRTYVISDFFYRLFHAVKRNRGAVIVYALCSVVFVVIGVAIGVNVADKTEYALRNGAPVFSFLRGDSGAAAFFFIELLFSVLYAALASGMFFARPLTLLSFAPCMYRSYTLGMHVCIIVGVYSASALPMLFVFFVPAVIVEIAVYCILSFNCRRFCSENYKCSPSKIDIKEYYKSLLPYAVILAATCLIKTFSVVLFGSALIGVI